MMKTRTVGMDFQKALIEGLKKVEEDANIHPTNKKLIVAYLRDAELGKTILKGQKRKVGIRDSLNA